MIRYLVALEYWKKDQNSTGYFWSEAIKAMRMNGLDVRVIHPKLQGSGQAAKPYARYQSALVRSLKKFSLSARIALAVLFRARKGDSVVCGTNPELLLALVVLFQKLKGYRVIVLVHDVFPENALAAAVLPKDGRFYRFLRTVFAWVYRQPAQMIVIGRDMKELIERKKKRSKPIAFIPNWVDHTDVTPIDRKSSTILHDLGWQDKIVFQFFGNLGRLQGIDTLLMGIDQIDHPKAAFLFVGYGVQATTVQNYCEANPDRAVKYFADFKDASRSDVLAACDVAIVSLGEGMYGLGVPSKAYFSMAADRPILAVVDEGSEIEQMIVQEQIGWVCRPGDPVGFARMVQEICDADPYSIEGAPRQSLLQNYAKTDSIGQFVDVVKDS
ncbi:glycosyltransferase family 4 protein [Sulfitobacter faviae]|uniref:glycosyltransferase family 4 protein n=1 Tax=Sulfitobacter faviae TaxID=1775881 RepID=UPI00398D579C